jgi:hypothetical protein
MVKLRKLELTEAIRARLAIVEKGAEYVNANGCGDPISYGGLDMLKLELANEVLAEIARQEMARSSRLDQIDGQLERKPAVVVEVSLRPKRNRRA